VCAKLSRSLEAQGLHDASDVGALAPGGSLPAAHRALLLQQVGQGGDDLLTEAVLRSRQVLLPAVERKVTIELSRRTKAQPPLLQLKAKSKAKSVTKAPSQQQINAAERRMQRLATGRGRPSQQATELPAPTLRSQEDAALDKAIDRGISLVYLLGPEAPRMRPFASDQPACQQLDEGRIMLLRDVVRDRVRNPVNLHRIIRGAETFVMHARAMDLSLSKLSAWDLGAYLQLEKARPRGNPGLLLRSISWLSRAGDFQWPVADPLVKSQCGPDPSSEAAEPPAQAPCPTLRMLKDMEARVFDAKYLVLRVYAGFIALLAHGCLRFSDAQHSKGLGLTADAIIGMSWKMKKKKKHQVPWAALRHGLAATDWGAHWLSQLAEANLPGPDYLLVAPSLDLRGFRPSIAKYNDVANVMRALLMLSGHTAQEALTFTPHSWRHVYPTLGRQLQVPDEKLDEVGHWNPKSGMPRRYDSAACVSELAAKSSILAAVAAGWTPVAPGCVPNPAPATPAPTTPAFGPAPSTPGAPPTKRLRRAATPNQRVAHHPSVKILVKDVIVLNTESGRHHFYAGHTATLCGLWQCGTAQQPASQAKFLDTAAQATVLPDSVCRRCRGSRLKALVNAPAAQQSSSDSPLPRSSSPSAASSSGSSSSSETVIAVHSDNSDDREVYTPTQ